MEVEQKQDFKSKFLLGKIKSKYLILRILSLASYERPSLWFLFKVNHSMRTLLTENWSTVQKVFLPQYIYQY